MSPSRLGWLWVAGINKSMCKPCADKRLTVHMMYCIHGQDTLTNTEITIAFIFTYYIYTLVSRVKLTHPSRYGFAWPWPRNKVPALGCARPLLFHVGHTPTTTTASHHKGGDGVSNNILRRYIYTTYAFRYDIALYSPMHI